MEEDWKQMEEGWKVARTETGQFVKRLSTQIALVAVIRADGHWSIGLTPARTIVFMGPNGSTDQRTEYTASNMVPFEQGAASDLAAAQDQIASAIECFGEQLRSLGIAMSRSQVR